MSKKPRTAIKKTGMGAPQPVTANEVSKHLKVLNALNGLIEEVGFLRDLEVEIIAEECKDNFIELPTNPSLSDFLNYAESWIMTISETLYNTRCRIRDELF